MVGWMLWHPTCRGSVLSLQHGRPFRTELVEDWLAPEARISRLAGNTRMIEAAPRESYDRQDDQQAEGESAAAWRTSMSVPGDFPRCPFPSALPGAQPKYIAREVGGKYVVGLTDEELQERYDVCKLLLEDLVTYARRKRIQRPEWSMLDILERIRAGVRSLESGFSEAEIEWLAEQVRRRIY